jgi:pilus assembly protein Flp/PilA
LKKLNEITLKLYFNLKYSQRGATAVEYSIIVSLISAVIIAVVFTLGEKTTALFETVVNTYP